MADPAWFDFHGDPADVFAALDDLLAAFRRPEWHQRAACRGQGPAAWFPGQGESVVPAKAVCAGCVVRAECEAAAVEERHGIWDDKSERERRQVRKLRRAA